MCSKIYSVAHSLYGYVATNTIRYYSYFTNLWEKYIVVDYDAVTTPTTSDVAVQCDNICALAVIPSVVYWSFNKYHTVVSSYKTGFEYYLQDNLKATHPDEAALIKQLKLRWTLLEPAVKHQYNMREIASKRAFLARRNSIINYDFVNDSILLDTIRNYNTVIAELRTATHKQLVLADIRNGCHHLLALAALATYEKL